MRSKLILILAALFLVVGAGISVFSVNAAPPASPSQSVANQRHTILSGVTQFTHADPAGGSSFDSLGAVPPHAGINNVIFGADHRANNVTNSWQNETSVAVNPLDPNVVNCSANDYSTGPPRAGWYHSADGGVTWSEAVITNTGTANSGDPAMAFGDNGHAYYTYIAFNAVFQPGGGIGFIRSSDGGATWSSNIPVDYTNSNNTFDDKEFMTVDNNAASPYHGRIYIAWGRVTDDVHATISAVHSTDDGLSWSVPVNAAGTVGVDENQGAWPRVAPNGNLFVAYLNDAPTPPQMQVVRSTDGGASFGPPIVAVSNVHEFTATMPGTNYRVNSFPTFAIDPTTGYLYMAWSDYVAGDSSILFTRSTDSGATWSTPVRIDDAPDGQQFFPAITASADGRVSVS